MSDSRLALALAASLATSAAAAGEVEVVKVDAVRGAANTYGFEVTLRHADDGWDHYADGWEVVGPDGTVLGTRVLYHPHVQEQPFTRGLSGVKIPAGALAEAVRPELVGLAFGDAKKRVVEGFEREFLLEALRSSGGNISRAAESIGMVRQSLQQKIRELGLRSEDWTNRN